MAKLLSLSGIVTGLPVEAEHVSQSIIALRGIEAYDISISGSLTVNGITFPYADGLANYVLVTDGAGQATFVENNSISSSYVSSSNVDGPLGMDSVRSSSYSLSSSFADFATQASSSFFALSTLAASTATSASYALTASHVTGLAETIRYNFTNDTGITVPHGLNTENLIIQVYEDDTTTGNLPVQIIPDTITINDLNTVQITFARATTGYVVLGQSGFMKSGSVDFAQTASFVYSTSFATTAAYALNVPDNVETASYVSSSNVFGPFGRDSIQTASLALTSSFITASDVHGPHGTSSIFSSSYAITASYVQGVGEAFRQNFVAVTTVTADHFLDTEDIIVQVYEEDPTSTGSAGQPRQIIPDEIIIESLDRVRVNFANQTSGYIVITKGGFIRAGSVENAQSASYAITSSHAITASFVLGRIESASFAAFAATASNALSAKNSTLPVRNDDNIRLERGTPVYVDSFDNERYLVRAASASDATRMPAIGLLSSSIDINEDGAIYLVGEIDNLNTFGFIEGGNIYVGATGSWTQTKPTGSTDIIQPIGIIGRTNPTLGKLIIQGPAAPLEGTAETASYALSSSTSQRSISSSYALTASFALNVPETASFALTASYISSSNVDGPLGRDSILSASYALTASHLLGINQAVRADFTNVVTVTVPHGLDSENVVVQVYQDDALTGNLPVLIVPDSVTLTDLNTVVVTFAVPTTGYVVVTQGGFLRSGSAQSALSASFAQNAVTASFTEFAKTSKNSVLPIFNDDIVAIGTGDPVYVEEFDGTHYRVRRADASDTTRMPAIGVATSTLALGATGEVLVVGELTGLNTFGLNAGRNIYVAVGGGVTQTEPAFPNLSQPLGIIGEESATAGRYVIQGPAAPVGSGTATTASYAETASFVTSSNVFGPFGRDSILSSSYALTASFALNVPETASLSLTASYISSSNVDGPLGMNSILSASYALTASHIPGFVDAVRADFAGVVTVAVPHGLDSENVLIQVYQEDATTGNLPVQIVPDSITLNDANNATITFATPTTGYVVIGQSGFLRSGSSQFALTASFATNATTASFTEFAKTSTNSVLPIFNDDGVVINTGDPVYLEEFDGTHYRVRRADASDPTRMPAIGVATSTLALGATGEVLVVGELTGLNTFGLNAGRNIYVAAGGGVTQTEPVSPNLSQPLGVIGEESATQGRYVIQGPAAPVGSGNAQTASLALTASYVSSSNVDGPFGFDSIRSASYALTASHIPGFTSAIRSDFVNQLNVTVAHGLNSENIVVQVYQDDATTGNLPVLIVPDSVTLTDLNTVDVVFAVPTTGHIVITQGGFLRSGSVNFAYTASSAFTASVAETASFTLFAKESQTNLIPIINDDTVVINQGDPVYIEEADGDVYRVRRADASNANTMPAIGLAQTTLAVGARGNAVGVGTVTGLNTFGLNIGRNVYVAAGGGWTQTPPTSPNQTQPLGVIGEESAVDGRIYVNGPISDISIGSATTASYITSSNVYGPFGSGSIETSSFALTASHVLGLTNALRFDFANSANVPVPHGLDSENVIVQVYQEDATTGNLPVMIVPDSVTLNDLNNATVTFAAPTTGYIVVTEGGFLKSGSVNMARSASEAVYSREVRVPILNDDTVQINIGDPVYIEESDTGFYRVRRADASTGSRMPAIGIAESNIPVGSRGDAMTVGTVSGINTFGLQIGRNIYVAAGGGFTQTAPVTPNLTQPLGVVGEESAIDGKLFINGPVSDISLGNATTASYVTSSNVYGPFGADSILTASYALTASHLEGVTPALRFDFTAVATVAVPHGLDSENVIIQVYQDDATTGNLPVMIVPDSITLNDVNNATITFAAPTTGYVVVTEGGFLKSGSTNFAFSSSTSVSSSYAETASFTRTTGELVVPIFNDDSVAIPRGYPVYVEEYDGQKYRVRLADASTGSRMPAIGAASTDLAVGASGQAIIVGDINGLNTFGSNIGRNIYVASGSGWTQTQPTGGNIIQPFGIIAEESATTGRFLIQGPMAESVGTAVTASYALTASFVEGIEPAIRFDFTGVNTVTVPHGLDSENVVVQVYQDDAATGNLPVQIVPDSITLTDNNTAVVNFAVPTTGYVVVTQGGFLRSGTIESASFAESASYAITASHVTNAYREAVAGNTVYPINHNLGEDYPFVQAWNTVTLAQEVPANVQTVNANSLLVTFAVVFQGVIIVKK